MDIKILRNFVEIADSGSLTAASKKLFLAQPALSNQLKALEKELQTTLIERNSRNQKLTDAGKLFYDRAKSIIQLEDAMIQEIRDAREGMVGSVRIATVPSGEIPLMQYVIPAFAKNFPQVTYDIEEKDTDQILSMLEEGLCDIGLVRTPCNFTADMDYTLFGKEKLVCAYNPEFFTLPGKEEITVSDLGDHPLLLIRRFDGIFRSLCTQYNFTPNIRIQGKHLAITLKWAATGLGIAVIPEDCASLSSMPLEIKTLRAKELTSRRGLVIMKNRYTSKAVANFAEYCKNILR